MPKVSVIIPVYNVEKYLSKCMDSVINQTLKDIEIICINDGSTDNSLNILEEYAKKDSRIKIISQENKGISVARNVGIKIATGEYIGFVDSDDWIDLDFYEKLYNEAINKNADISVAGIKKYTFKKTKNLIKFQKVTKANKVTKKYKLCFVPIYNYVWNKIYKRNILNKTNILFEEGIQFEDIMFTHKILYYSNSIVAVPNIYYWYRMDNFDSITSQATLEKKKYYFEAYNQALKFVASHKIKVGLSMPYIWDSDIQYTFLGIHIFRIRKIKNFVQFCLFKNIVLFEYKRTLYEELI